MIARGLPRLVRQRVVIHTKTGSSIRGVLRDVYRDCVSIAEPEFLHEAQPADLAGAVVIERGQIDWIQVL